MRTPSPFGELQAVQAAHDSPIAREINRLAIAVDDAHSVKNMMLERLEPVTSPSWVSNQRAPRPEQAPPVREQVCPVAQRIADLADTIERQNDNCRGLVQALEV